MSLQSRIGIKDFTEKTLVGFKTRLKNLLGKDIEVNCDIPSFDKAGENNGHPFFAHSYYNEGFEKNCFEPLLKVFGDMMKEPTMKEYLLESLNSINLEALKNSDSMDGYAKLENGVLTARGLVHANIGSSKLEFVVFDAIDKSAA